MACQLAIVALTIMALGVPVDADEVSEPTAPDGARRAAEESPPAVPETTVFQVETLRAAAPIETYRLERAYYEHLLRVAHGLAAQRRGGPVGPVSIADLEPPARPRLTLTPVRDAPRAGPSEPPALVVVVENLSQIYSQRLDAELQRLRARFGDQVTLVHVDHIQEHTHRHSMTAAIAARCAHEQGQFWAYRALLLANLEHQARADLVQHATALTLDRAAFETCLDRTETHDTVVASATTARRAGITRAPTVLVNGIYVGGAEPAGTVTGIVETALAAGETPHASVPDSALPFDVTGIMLLPGRPPEAIVVARDTGRGRIITVGDRLTDAALVTAIVRSAVLVRHGDVHERLPLRAGTGAALADAPLPTDRALVTEHVHSVPIDPTLGAEFAKARAGIEAQFTPAALDMDGKRLLKLTGTEHTALLARVGLEPGDALVRINDAWVFHGDNPLVDAVGSETPTTLVIVRRGIPRLIELRPRGD